MMVRYILCGNFPPLPSMLYLIKPECVVCSITPLAYNGEQITDALQTTIHLSEDGTKSVDFMSSQACQGCKVFLSSIYEDVALNAAQCLQNPIPVANLRISLYLPGIRNLQHLKTIHMPTRHLIITSSYILESLSPEIRPHNCASRF